MKDADIETMIAKEFEAPEPIRRDDFLNMYSVCRKNSNRVFALSQIRYIHKVVWISSIVIFLLAAVLLQKSPQSAMLFTSLVTPFAAGIGVFATVRSRIYKMQEMEASTLVSYRGVIFARLVIIALSHLILLLGLSIIMGLFGAEGIILSGCRICLPYLFTSFLCMKIERSKSGRENPYLCLTVSAGVSLIFFLWQIYPEVIGIAFQKTIFMAATIVLLFANISEIITLYKGDEKGWNFV